MIEKRRWQSGVEISYWTNETTGNFHVTLQCLQQTIVILPRAFKRILEIDYNAEVGAREISVQQAVELGFVFPLTFSVMKHQDVI